MEEAQRDALVKTVGRAIAVKRDSVGLSQERVAEMLGISREAVSRMETGASVPSIVRLGELAEIFDCGLDELLSDASNRKLDQARKLLELLEGCAEKDQDMLLGVLKQLAGSLAAKHTG